MSEPMRRKGRREVDPDVLAAEKEIRRALAETLIAFRKAHWGGWGGIRRMAEAADMSEANLANLLLCKWSPSISTLVRIARAFGLRLVIRFE